MIIAIAQTKPDCNADSNLKEGIFLCEKAFSNNADLILFPEMYNTGYKFSEDIFEKAITLNSNYLNQFREAAKKIGIAIAITFLEKKNSLFYNSALLIDMNGNDVVHYSKVHTCDFSSESVLTPGSDFFVSELKTKTESVQTGFMICFDREFPESARILMLKGAELVLVPNACEIEDNRKSQIKSRAFENSVAIILANYCGDNYKGGSLAVSPVAFDKNEKSLETITLDCNNEENLFYVNLDLKKIREYRNREVWGNAYRKIKSYNSLTEDISIPDFIRSDNKKYG